MSLDLSAFAPAETALPLETGAGQVYDKDGILVPPFWHPNVAKWEKQAVETRQNLSRKHTEHEALKARTKKQPSLPEQTQGSRAGATNFTTDYGAKYGRRQGWKEIDRERWNAITRRHSDLQLGMDLLFDDGKDGMVGIQAAGKHERAAHYQRFLERGGPEKAKRRHIRVLYLEFVRDNHEPVLLEWWA